MTDKCVRWLGWRERISELGTEGRDARAVLRWAAEEIAAACPRGAPATQRWASTGVTVRLALMRGRGRCDLSAETPVLHVNKGDNRYAQHFTVAHEIGHLLLSALPSEQREELSYRAEERLCDEFAHRVIVPPDELAEDLGGELPALEQVLRLCGLFEANPRTMVQALGGQLHLEHTAYLLAKWRGHYQRPDVIGFRVETVAGPKSLYWPPDKRIEGLGLKELARLAEEASHGTFFKGIDAEVTVLLRRVDSVTRQNAMTGPVYWQAVRQGRDKDPYLLAQIDCSNLAAERLRKGANDRPLSSPRGTVSARSCARAMR